MPDSRLIPLRVTLDGRQLESETVCVWSGPYVMTIATTLPQAGIAIEVQSVFVGHEDIDTYAVYLTLGPVGSQTQIVKAEYDRESLDPTMRPTACAYEHAHIVLEALKRLGGASGAIEVPDHAFEDLERVEPH